MPISLDPFPILLNNLSNELEEKDLQSLKNICAQYIPGGQRERIKDGWDIFNILQRQNVIGDEPEKMANLLLIIKVLKRTDLVHMIKKHIVKFCEQLEVILNSVKVSESSGPNITLYASNNQIHRDEQRPSSPCWILNCSCCELTCYSSCFVLVTILFTFFAVVAILAWYADIPEVTSYLKSKEDLKKAGPYIVGFLLFVAACCALCGIIFTLKRSNRHYGQPDQDNQRINNQVICSPDSHSPSLNSARTSPVLTRPSSFSSNQVTASCSLSSVEAPRVPQVCESETASGGEKFFTPIPSRNASSEIS